MVGGVSVLKLLSSMYNKIIQSSNTSFVVWSQIYVKNEHANVDCQPIIIMIDYPVHTFCPHVHKFNIWEGVQAGARVTRTHTESQKLSLTELCFFHSATTQSFLSVKQKKQKRHPSRGVFACGWPITRGLGHALISGTKMSKICDLHKQDSTPNEHWKRECEQQ